MKKNLTIGIALSGGSARGIAHIGVLRALIENGIVPDIAAGTSAGSIVGAFYCAGKSLETMLQFVKEGTIFKVFRFVSLPFNGLAKMTYLNDQLIHYIGAENDSFEALKKPLYLAVSNLTDGRSEIISSGKLFEAITASCSIPLVFKPIEINGKVCVDGGLFNNLPANAIRDKCDIVIGVNVMTGAEPPSGERKLDSALRIAVRCSELTILSNTKPNLNLCDILIEPENMRRFGLFDMHHAEHISEAGYESTMRKMPAILRLLQKIKAQKAQEM